MRCPAVAKTRLTGSVTSIRASLIVSLKPRSQLRLRLTWARLSSPPYGNNSGSHSQVAGTDRVSGCRFHRENGRDAHAQRPGLPHQTIVSTGTDCGLDIAAECSRQLQVLRQRTAARGETRESRAQRIDLVCQRTRTVPRLVPTRLVALLPEYAVSRSTRHAVRALARLAPISFAPDAREASSMRARRRCRHLHWDRCAASDPAHDAVSPASLELW